MGSSATIAERLGDRLGGIRYERLPTDVVERAKLWLLDQLGIQLRGATLPESKPAIALARALGGPPESTIPLIGDREGAPDDALAPAALGDRVVYEVSIIDDSDLGVSVVLRSL